MVTIEKATKDDLPFIIDIEKKSFSNPWSPEQVISSFEKTYAAKEDGIIKGFICLEAVLDEIHILHMAVHPDYRKRGVAKKMMEFALGIKSKKFFLEVRESNYQAQRLYEHFGFGVISKRYNYYQDNGETAYVMELSRNG